MQWYIDHCQKGAKNVQDWLNREIKYIIIIITFIGQWLFRTCKIIALYIFLNMTFMHWSCLFFQKQNEVKSRNVNDKPKERRNTGTL